LIIIYGSFILAACRLSQRVEALQSLGHMALATIAITIVSRAVFYAGLRRYESGIALNINV
jgi:hypothetical protein